MKLAEKEIPDCNDKSLMILSEELTIKYEEIAHLKPDVKKLKKKLKTMQETGLSPKIPEIMSHKPNKNKVSKAHLDLKEQVIKLQAVNRCEEQQNFNKELKENIDKVLGKAKENIRQYKNALNQLLII
ncbi:hypothetical protein TNCV_2692291 [Trichonephila clavipes]|uniref:Uncharacterized protein n=1 Tax=Trichonephila clavipes TaxID=2585209 RepID=A0A8X7BAQ6_TRICX|nr:hypothetical protein TNCV_2692291 [Trichonephila clavipes]